ncbi:MAG: DUF420 domain-containing protein [Planctomycetia bacterium]|nr:DUF420 domain-containing protein [Planctomycetia bacterium]
MYRGIDGFLPYSRASIMLDVVFVAMFVVVPALAASICLVKFRRRYALHKKIQLALGATLLVAVALFELDMQFVSGWLDRAKASPYFEVQREAGDALAPGFYTLYVHLAIAVTTALLWIVVIAQALRKFGRPPAPGLHSRWHARLGTAAAIGMFLTALTGWIFYWQAFVAT